MDNGKTEKETILNWRPITHIDFVLLSIYL